MDQRKRNRGDTEVITGFAPERVIVVPRITAVSAPFQFCGCPTVSGVTTAACNTTCPDTSKVGAYVEVSAQGSYDTILPYPTLPRTFLFTAKSTARVQ